MNVTLKQYRQLLGTYLAPQKRRRVLVLGLVMAADLVLQLALPRVVQTFIDSAIAGVALRPCCDRRGLSVRGHRENLTLVGWQYVAQNIGLIATNRIRADLTLHCLKLDMGFHNARTPGEMIERIDGDVTRAGQLPVELSLFRSP